GFGYNYNNQREVVSLLNLQHTLNNNHPFVTELLLLFKDHLVVCGGSLTRAIINEHEFRGHHGTSDVDFFFYDLERAQATQLREDAISHLFMLWQTNDIRKLDGYQNEDPMQDRLSFVVHRNQLVTTVSIVLSDEQTCFQYQFIHRIYPSISSIIGGFDLGPCMIAYDGKELYATPLGAWSIQNKAIIVDTKRRSPSFEYRLNKFCQLGFAVIFPGLPRDYYINCYGELHGIKEREFSEKAKLREPDVTLRTRILALADELDYDVTVDHDAWDEIFVKNNSEDDDEYDRPIKVCLPYLELKPQDAHCKIWPTNRSNKSMPEKLSDYNYNEMYCSLVPFANGTRLRHGNFAGLLSIIELPLIGDGDIRTALRRDLVEPDLGFESSGVIFEYIQRTEKMMVPRQSTILSSHSYAEQRGKYDDRGNKMTPKRWQKCYEKYVNEIKHCTEYFEKLQMQRLFGQVIHDRSKIPKIASELVQKMTKNHEIGVAGLTGLQWITQNPGGQYHTSSFNPIIRDPKDWYGPDYIKVWTGMPELMESNLRLIRRAGTDLSTLQKEIFDQILRFIAAHYAGKGFLYIR
ncbi:MAG: hypothetical protein ACMG6E_01655, partial [Candidatus Roizmanbacteria bacterium]